MSSNGNTTNNNAINDLTKSPSDPGHVIFDSIEIQPSRQNFGTVTKRTRPTVVDLSMGNLKKHFERDSSNSKLKLSNQNSTEDINQILDDQELNENDAAISESKQNKKGFLCFGNKKPNGFIIFR